MVEIVQPIERFYSPRQVSHTGRCQLIIFLIAHVLRAEYLDRKLVQMVLPLFKTKKSFKFNFISKYSLYHFLFL